MAEDHLAAPTPLEEHRRLKVFAGEWDGSIPALFVYDRAGHLRASFVGQLENADIRRMLADTSVTPPVPPAR